MSATVVYHCDRCGAECRGLPIVECFIAREELRSATMHKRLGPCCRSALLEWLLNVRTGPLTEPATTIGKAEARR